MSVFRPYQALVVSVMLWLRTGFHTWAGFVGGRLWLGAALSRERHPSLILTYRVFKRHNEDNMARLVSDLKSAVARLPPGEDTVCH